MKMIVTKPQHDVTTRYLSAWAEEVIELAEEKGVDVIELLREKANKKEFESRVNKLSPRLIFLNGHGSDECVTGHDNKILVKSGENHEVLVGKITYALSCNSAKILGTKVAQEKDTAYIGYADEFIFMAGSECIRKPALDPKAKPFMEASNQVMISVLKGHSARESAERSKNIFRDRYIKLLSSNTDQDSLQAAQYLWWNMRNLVCLGDGDVTA